MMKKVKIGERRSLTTGRDLVIACGQQNCPVDVFAGCVTECTAEYCKTDLCVRA